MLFSSYHFALSGIGPSRSSTGEKKIVTSTKRIHVPSYPGAYNPSIVKFSEDAYLLTFRYLPYRAAQPWLSHIGVILLDESFEPISNAELLNTRFNFKGIPSQAEDARVFSCNGKFYVIYNDNMDLMFPSIYDRRDMYVAELLVVDDQFLLSDPVKLIHEEKYPHVLWQKNWSPFEWNGTLLLTYTINPHEIVCPNLETGRCQSCYETQKSIEWDLGPLRGGTPAQLIDGEYLAFFHSGAVTTSPSSDNRELWHYFMGAYTFSADPPFEKTKISSSPIDSPGFYTYSSYEKRVIYPGGYVVNGSNLYVAYGKDDCEIWIATIDLNELKNSMVSVK